MKVIDDRGNELLIVKPVKRGDGNERLQSFEVNEPILNSPVREPTRYWYIQEGEAADTDGRPPAAFVFPPTRPERAVEHRRGLLLAIDRSTHRATSWPWST